MSLLPNGKKQLNQRCLRSGSIFPTELSLSSRTVHCSQFCSQLMTPTDAGEELMVSVWILVSLPSAHCYGICVWGPLSQIEKPSGLLITHFFTKCVPPKFIYRIPGYRGKWLQCVNSRGPNPTWPRSLWEKNQLAQIYINSHLDATKKDLRGHQSCLHCRSSSQEGCEKMQLLLNCGTCHGSPSQWIQPEADLFGPQNTDYCSGTFYLNVSPDYWLPSLCSWKQDPQPVLCCREGCPTPIRLAWTFV